MKNVKDEYGISKSRKVEILTEMGYRQNSIIKELYFNTTKELSLAAKKHWIYEFELDEFFPSDKSFIDFVNVKLNQ